MAMSVVPPPMSTSATPSSFSSSVSTASLAASCSTTVSATVDAGAVHARHDVLRRALAAGDDVDVHLEARAGHADRRADAVLLVDDEVLRQHVQDLAAGRQRHGLRRIDRAPHVLARDLAVLAGDGDHAAAVEALDVRARQREVHRVDLDAGHQLRFLDGLLDRLDGRLEVDDDAAPDAARLGDAEADDVEAAAVEDLADDGRHLRRADVEPDQIPFFACHAASAVTVLAGRRPVRPRRRALRRPSSRLHVNRGRRTAGPHSRCPAPGRAAPARARDTTAAARRNWSVAELDHRRVAREDHRGVVRDRSRRSATRGCATSGSPCSAAIDPRRRGRRAPRPPSTARLPVDASGRRRSAGRDPRTAGRTRSMTAPRSSTRYSSPFRRPTPIGCRSDDDHSTVDGQRRAGAPRRAPTATPADARRHARGPSDRRFSPAQPARARASTSPVDSRSLPRTTMRSICEHARVRHGTRARDSAVDRRQRDHHDRQRASGRDDGRQRRAGAPASRARGGSARSAGAATAAHDAPPRQGRDQRDRRTRADRAGAERDARGRRARAHANDRRHDVVERAARPRPARVTLRRTASASASSVTPAIGSSPAG